MKNLKPINIIFAALALAIVAAMAPQSISAQGRYSTTYSKNQVKGYIDRLENSSNTFRKDFDRYMDRSALNGTDTEDRYNQYVKDYESAVDRLQREYNSRNNWWDNRSDVEYMLDKAQPVNAMIIQLPFARNIERQWQAMRNDINKVADTFDLPGLNGGGWNGGGWNGGNNGGWNGSGDMSTPPNWAQGTFTWQGSDPRSMTIDRSGRVTLVALGRTTYGTYYRNVVRINGDNLNVSRISNGIRLYNPVGRGTSDWIAGYNGGWNGGNNGGNNGGWNGGGQMSSPPSWARGSFSWIGSDPRTMSIDKNGRVTLTSFGRTVYGTFYRNVISINGDSLTISRNGNGIRLYNPNGGGTSDWRRL